MSEPAQSPPKDAEQHAQSPGDEGHMDDSQDQAGGYEFDGVKEQDRWLPIANGTLEPLAAAAPTSAIGAALTCASQLPAS